MNSDKRKFSQIRVKYSNGYETIEEANLLKSVKTFDLLDLSIKTNLNHVPTIVIGAVSVNYDDESNVNVIVGTSDLIYQEYKGYWCKQTRVEPTVEMTEDVCELNNYRIDNLKDIAVQLFSQHKKFNSNKLAKNIIYYRDGRNILKGSDQLKVCQQEVQMLKTAHKEVFKGFVKPLVTCVVLCNESQVEFLNEKKSSIKRQDYHGLVIEPLFIIESNVLYSREFYLACSETTENSVVKPHRYKILIDEINFSSENIFNLTYKLCHTFFKHKKCVEYPSCLYYANLLVKYLCIAKNETDINKLIKKEDNDEQHELTKRLINIYKFETQTSSSSSSFKKVPSQKENSSSNFTKMNNKEEDDQCRSSDMEKKTLVETSDQTQPQLSGQPNEKENEDSVSSAFDTCVFLVCFTVYFLILIWVSIKTAPDDEPH